MQQRFLDKKGDIKRRMTALTNCPYCGKAVQTGSLFNHKRACQKNPDGAK